MPTYFKIEGWVQTPQGNAVPGASVAILSQPANTATQPGTPLASLYSAPNSNPASITGASWAGGQITFLFSGSVPLDVVPGTYIGLTGINPGAYNGDWLVLSVNGLSVAVASLSNPGTYISGGTVATSVLPNPLTTDGNGYWFGYTLPGFYTYQIYGPVIPELDYPDELVSSGTGGSSSISLGMPVEFIVTGSPGTTLIVTKATESANFVWAGPTSGAAAVPTFRALGNSDLPIRTVRTSFTPNSGNIANGYVNITVTFGMAFLDTNYTPECTLSLGTIGAWPQSTAVTAGQFIIDTNGNLQKCTTPGTTGGSTPVFSQVAGGTTPDGGTVVWAMTTIVNQGIFMGGVKSKTASGFVFEVTVNGLLPLVLNTTAIHD
jgi:hypothetical protein